jgi:hypothetical protein
LRVGHGLESGAGLGVARRKVEWKADVNAEEQDCGIGGALAD